MENILQPWVSWSFLQNNNHQVVKKPKVAEYFSWIKYIYIQYIFIYYYFIIALS